MLCESGPENPARHIGIHLVGTFVCVQDGFQRLNPPYFNIFMITISAKTNYADKIDRFNTHSTFKISKILKFIAVTQVQIISKLVNFHSFLNISC